MRDKDWSIEMVSFLGHSERDRITDESFQSMRGWLGNVLTVHDVVLMVTHLPTGRGETCRIGKDGSKYRVLYGMLLLTLEHGVKSMKEEILQ